MDHDTDTQASTSPATGSADVKPFPVAGQQPAAASTSDKPQPADSNAATSAAPVVDGLIKRATQRAHDAVDGVAAKLSSTVDGIQGGVGKVGDTRDEWLDSAREAIRQHPFAAIGTAVLIGLALRSLSSRDR